MNAYTDFTERTVEYNKLLSDFKQLLKENGLKFTIQREVILEMLYNSDEHLTPEGRITSYNVCYTKLLRSRVLPATISCNSASVPIQGRPRKGSVRLPPGDS